MSVEVGDTVTFSYNSYHNVYIHPTGTCDRDGGSLLGGNDAGSVTYTFTEPGPVTFACQAGSHCDSGQIVTITASRPPRCPLIIDVRTAEEWAVGHIACASRVQWNAADLVEQVLALAATDTSQPVVTYCDTGGAAAQVQELLAAAGFSAVTSGGGIGIEEDVAALEAMCDLCAEMCPADVTGAGVNVSDLLAVLSAFGTQDSSGHHEVIEDINIDGIVNASDILATLSAFGSC